MNSCQTCRHWNTHRSSVRAVDDAIGECHGVTPIRDFTWPRTKATDWCGSYSVRGPLGKPPEPVPQTATAELFGIDTTKKPKRKPAAP